MRLKKCIDNKFIEILENNAKKLISTENVKLVGIRFYLLADGDMLITEDIFDKEFNPDDYY